ncbi:hypothetical protein BBJ28_00026382 [Nothophytophthora sp. Chile5]|nr:hypothetical protein BBJ28_00026382 [Nothophytophthora sp. Chile5]
MCGAHGGSALDMGSKLELNVMRKQGRNEAETTMITKPVRVLSERIMSRGFEPTVARLMENVSGRLTATGFGRFGNDVLTACCVLATWNR